MTSEFVVDKVDYIRGFLEPCVFEYEDRRIHLYPQIKIYQNGVITVSLRVISPTIPIDSDSFIDNFLNLHFQGTRVLLVPPALLLWDSNYWLLKGSKDQLNTKGRVADLRELKRIKKIVEQKQMLEVGDTFSHLLVTVDPEGKLEKPSIKVDLLHSMIFSAVAGVLNQPRTGWQYIVFGQKPYRYEQGNFWYGMPSIFIKSFKNQPKSATKIREQFGFSLGQILARSKSLPQSSAQEILGESLRAFDDYTAHISSGARLWVYTSAFIENSKPFFDANHNHLIFAPEAQTEFVDYVQTSFRKLEETSTLSSASIESLIKDRKKRNILEQMVSSSSNVGEIQDLIRFALRVMKIEDLRSRVDENLLLHSERLKERRGLERQNFEWILVGLFGLLGATNLGKDVLKPLWLYWGWTVPVVKELADVFFIFLAVLLIGLSIFAFWWRYRKRLGDQIDY